MGDPKALVEDASSLNVDLYASKLDKNITFHDYESDRLETLLVSARCTSRVTSLNLFASPSANALNHFGKDTC